MRRSVDLNLANQDEAIADGSSEEGREETLKVGRRISGGAVKLGVMVKGCNSGRGEIKFGKFRGARVKKA